ncbi:hypothetical protein [Pedobacter sp. UC225_65]|uniref:hypothetical protein n=1 Tax=Pedobacter sp. UC225_65 TaxID=3350173 RepID=UPI00366E2CCD
MKKTLYTLFLLFAATVASAQDINKIITKDYVDHLIKTLSSDEMQGRATFSPGSTKRLRLSKVSSNKSDLNLLLVLLVTAKPFTNTN